MMLSLSIQGLVQLLASGRKHIKFIQSGTHLIQIQVSVSVRTYTQFCLIHGVKHFRIPQESGMFTRTLRRTPLPWWTLKSKFDSQYHEAIESSYQPFSASQLLVVTCPWVVPYEAESNDRLTCLCFLLLKGTSSNIRAFPALFLPILDTRSGTAHRVIGEMIGVLPTFCTRFCINRAWDPCSRQEAL